MKLTRNIVPGILISAVLPVGIAGCVYVVYQAYETGWSPLLRMAIGSSKLLPKPNYQMRRVESFALASKLLVKPSPATTPRRRQIARVTIAARE